MKGSRVPALLVGLTAALTLAACGVPPSDAIQVGAPASGLFSPEPSVATVIPVYFLRNGALTPYPRKVSDPGDFGSVVGLLFAGPARSEAATATTELPRLAATPNVTLGSDNAFSVQLPEDVPPLSHRAMLQLVCTVAHLPYGPVSTDANRGGASAAPSVPAPRSVAHTSIHVLGSGWAMTQSSGSCPDPVQP
ncbi:hypothetical protein ACFVXE_04725 [Streptomyces sp. NPDC058231]|uniref:hypothetical protein n=1 Tax=Streptomyces sp. NPDC058231 TaxID=3346392 RepID=UPI0036E516B2